jgi:hypothetical protein
VAENAATELLEQALRAAVDISFEDERAKAIAHLARFFSSETARTFAKNITQETFEWSRGWCLKEIRRNTNPSQAKHRRPLRPQIAFGQQLTGNRRPDSERR